MVLIHVKCESGVVANTLSTRHPRKAEDVIKEKEALQTSAYFLANHPMNDEYNETKEFLYASKLVTHEDLNLQKFPLSPKLMAKAQLKDIILQKAMKSNPEGYDIIKVEEIGLISRNGKIQIPIQLQQMIVAWDHLY